MSCRFLALLCAALLTLPVASAERAANPYCVSGGDWRSNGTLQRLEMPAETLGYQWGAMVNYTDVQMVRPCLSGVCQPYSYVKQTDSIYDAAAFAAWVAAHPGQTWLVGNEPNVVSQDGLQTDQYTRMYRLYYTTIKGLDPTARIATAGIYSAVHPSGVDGVTYMIDWYTQVLDYYRDWYGETMPVDVWNFHFYVPAYVRDARDVIEQTIDPFCAWVKTVEDGAYADAEIWCTEWGIGFWMGNLNNTWVEPWMQRLCLELEYSQLDRWFWFVGAWTTDPDWQQTCLLGPTGQKSVLGETYSVLANGYPNAAATPKPDPEILYDPPDVFVDDFEDGDVSDWFDKAGPWIADAGTMLCDYPVARPGRWWGMHQLRRHWYQDVTIQARVRIEAAPATNYWTAVVLHVPSLFDDLNAGGWMVFMRQNGLLSLYTHSTGSLVEVPDAVDDTSTYHTLRVDMGGIPTVIDVYLDGERRIHHIDTNTRFPEGLVGLANGMTRARYDDVLIATVPLMDPIAYNGDFESGTASDIAPWIKWRASSSATEVQWLHLMGAGQTGRNGTAGLRVTVPNLAKVFDAGVRRAVPGAKPDRKYAVEGWVRCSHPVGERQFAMLGIDPTGQVTDEKASTIRWANVPADLSFYTRVQTPYVQSTEGRISVWFRARNTEQRVVWMDVDDIAILDAPFDQRDGQMGLY